MLATEGGPMHTDLKTAARRAPLLRMLRALALCTLGLLLAQTLVPQAKALEQHRPLIVFMSDFGELDDAVAICKGVMKTIAPDAEIIDLTHQVTPYSISEGSRMLVRTSQYYPAGTIFVTVI